MLPPLSTSQSSHLATIGMLTARLNGPNEINLWHGVADRAKERNVNLICFSGGIPHRPQLYETQKNILFKIAGQQNVDGLLIWANILSLTLDPAGMLAFCQHYNPLPVISMGMVLPTIPSVRIDMREGMHRLLSHLIEEHGRRKIAFIRGPEVSQDAEERYQAYLETLKQYGLSFNPSLVVSGDFYRHSGLAAARHLIDTGQTDFDALVSANDNMAIGAMQAIQAHGMHIPDDVILAGFDDIEETRAISPSLTTVRTPWHLLGSKSVDLVLSRLSGEMIPDQILLETEVIYRQSCGCQQMVVDNYQSVATEHIQGSANRVMNQHTTPSKPIALRSKISNMLSTLAPSRGWEAGLAEKLSKDFLSDVQSKKNTPGAFIQTLEELLSAIPTGTEILEWLDVLNFFRTKVNPLFQSKDDLLKAHSVIEQGFALVGGMAHRQQLYQRLEAVEQTNRLNKIIQTMVTTHGTEELMTLLAQELPGLGIQSCFLSLYEERGENPTWSRLILAFLGQKRMQLDRGGIRFPTRKLVPQGMFPENRRYDFDVEALFFQEEQIGFVLFEIGPRDGDVYTALRGHLSSALKSAELVQVALEAEAKAIKSDELKTHLLANVSHELRAPLNIILGLSQTALSNPNPYGSELPAQLIRDMGYIYDSGEHLIRLINDLLDMSRAEIGELDLCIEPVSPRTLLKDVYETFDKTSANKQKNIELLLEVPDHLPILHADAVRLRQILMNLLSNAFKFTQEGKIILGAEVQLPHIHFWVSDTGVGITPELQDRIFEPFVKIDPPGNRQRGIGLGLSITRRLVALHGGSITLDSLPGHGSTFHVYIPLPGLDYDYAKAFNLEGAQPLMLWLSSNEQMPPSIIHICDKNGFKPYWLENMDNIEQSLKHGKPIALAWNLENARPGDWSVVQKLRGYSQFCQMPLLIIHENIGGMLSGKNRLTNVLLKPAGKQILQHVLDLLPQAVQRGEIWVIDDDPHALKYYQEMISSSLSEFLVRAICSGMEALNLLENEIPDLVLLDLMMPEVDGFQVLNHLRSNVKTALIPVIIITGKILSYDDIKRLDAPKVMLQTKGVLSELESVASIQRMLIASSALPQPTSMLVKQASAFIQQNYTRSFSLDELSKKIGVSKSYLSRIFKTDTGISLWDYLNRYRIQKAKELLLLTDESITSIAADVGFEDVGYFGRVFREITGCSPRAFRQHATSSIAA